MHYVKELSIHFKIKSGFNKCYLYKTRKGYLLATLFQNNTQWKTYFLVLVIFIFVIFILVVFIEAKNLINFVDHFA